MILYEIADNESQEYKKDFIHDTFSPESITLAVRGRSSDLFPPCGLPALILGSDPKDGTELVLKLTATGIVPDSHRIPFSLDTDDCPY